MKEQVTAIAIATVMVATGFSIAPSVQAGHTDCHEDFEIAESELLASTRDLDPGERKIGLTTVDSAEDDQTVTVELRTDDMELEATIFDDVGGCDESDNVSQNCDDTVVLNTEGQQSQDSVDCVVESPSSGDRDFFFHLESPTQNDGSLDYKIYES